MGFFRKRLAPAVLLAATAFVLAPAAASAQDPGTWTYIPDPQRPVAIEADTISVNSTTHTATFSGHVLMIDGWVRMQCTRLVVYYDSGGHTLGQVDRIECEPHYVHLLD
jgi:lipopolysaccharide export system protein LptA